MFQYIRNGLRYNIWYSSGPPGKYNILARTFEGAARQEGKHRSAICDELLVRLTFYVLVKNSLQFMLHRYLARNIASS